MSNLINKYQLATDSTFYQRVKMASYVVGLNYLNDGILIPNETYTPEQQQYITTMCRRMIESFDVSCFCFAITVDDNINDESDDETLIEALKNLINIVAKSI